MEGQVQSPKLLRQVRNVLRLHHYSIHTERSYLDWIKRYVHFHRMRCREDLADGERKIEAFLTDLAVRGKVSASTQNQAMNALVFLYRKVLEQPLDEVIDAVRAERKVNVPVVPTREEVSRVIAVMEGVPQLQCSTFRTPAASVNNTTPAMPIPYATHVRYSPGLHRACTGAVPAMHRADRGTHSQVANVVSHLISEPCLRNRA
jgi:hypothetical protein